MRSPKPTIADYLKDNENIIKMHQNNDVIEATIKNRIYDINKQLLSIISYVEECTYIV